MDNLNQSPLVSIIVRTKDRPKLLKRALESISAQTYRPIEVVLVNDGGCDLDIDEIKNILRNISLNYIRLELNTGRAHAGNVGIENAKGDYIGFLDDDDEFYPEHVETLISFLIQSDYKSAYCATQLIESFFNADDLKVTGGNRLIFAQEFSYEHLLVDNYIPLISLMFRADFLRSLMFDESFDLYEDWDLLIRAGKVTKFYFINKITATYNQWGNDQIAFKSPPEIINQAKLKIYTKHWMEITPECFLNIRQETIKQEAVKKEAVILEKDNLILQLEVKINNIQKTLNEREDYINKIHSSRGWRLLTKYYKMKKWLFH